MRKAYADLPGWTFDMDEVSANVYEVVGRDDMGNSVFVKGVDLDVVVAECIAKARQLSAPTNSTKN